jgi:hypothetical protein
MTGLLDEVLAAHGGAQRWQSVSAITARGRLGGLLPKRFPGNKLANFTVAVHVAEQHTVLHDFPHAGMRAVFDRGDVRIETHDGERLDTRTDPRSAFFGLSGIRRNVRWDPLDVTVTEGEPWRESGQRWRRLQATFPAQLDIHSWRQTFYADTDGLIRRHDFVAEPVGNWAKAALYCDQHLQFDGLVFPTRRRVFPRGPGRRVLSRPTFLALDFDEIEIERYHRTQPHAAPGERQAQSETRREW